MVAAQRNSSDPWSIGHEGISAQDADPKAAAKLAQMETYAPVRDERQTDCGYWPRNADRVTRRSAANPPARELCTLAVSEGTVCGSATTKVTGVETMNKSASPSRVLTQMTPGDVARVEQFVVEALALQQAGHIEQAMQIYQDVLAEQPTNASALTFLGMAHFQRRDFVEAERLIATAIAFRPEYVDAFNNLGNVFLAQGRLAEAGLCYQNALSRNPSFAPAIVNLGVVLRRLGCYEEAESLYQAALKTCADSEIIHYSHGTLLLMRGKVGEAIAELEWVHRRLPDDHTRQALAMAYYSGGEYARARQILAEWHAADPDNPIANHMLAAYVGEAEAVPDRASDDYVRSVFNSFAGSFDQVVHGLDYRVPTLVAATLQQLFGPGQRNLRVLDAGCGTGLCGTSLRAYADRLTGVDLSAGMLAKAKESELYDELVMAELTEFLGAAGPRYDLIAAGDALCYFGDLGKVLSLLAGRLHRRGVLVATFELSQEGKPGGYKLNLHGRYSHQRDYLLNGLDQAGLRTREVVESELRREIGVPVRGMLVVGEKPQL
jgi:predicted TPR repeat methyltransferase